ncbi:pH-dependent sodium/proton antiporter [Candidatus Thiomargarita nelsonii]|uniref:Na(+)/H(+) antiporter NhaA n=1 Tax=Candidatus Thiomargarita nelsonii TaxID=1003181 RepID=A0A0A6S1R3_9GAMM|nr:pH-dependent sodium/proton antiporter [Candidatus Thiomargarita nelsonii]
MLSYISNTFREFIKLESASSILLLLGAVLALLMSNSDWAHFYGSLLHTHGSILNIEIKPVEFWVNDGLMAIFFLLVGLELKREMLEGELSNLSQIALPTIAAVGGMAVPALIYVVFNWNDPTTMNGWAIPSATDIAFSLGILALLGSRVPLSLKLFLMALAIIDDLGAIVIIALFYSGDLHLSYLAFAAITLAVPVILFHWKGITSLTVYLIVGLLLWFFVLKSGIHATLAGVALAFFIPNVKDSHGHSPLHRLEKGLHPWVAFGILPIFAFANAGVSFEGMTLSVLWEPVPLGIVLGLFLGKQLGVFGFTWLIIKLGFAELPDRATWLTLYGVSILCGVGFTMSLFIGGLAFTEPAYMNQVRLGVLVGSFVAAIVGYLILLMATAGTIPEDE